ncbi:MAG: phosphoribosylformylglycinamidine synthase subunit PurS [Nanoarchaeota archaeon]|nr:phosphoribosylformylglycinamidine synthase subunit PurS [Nanoarchaeota archaeon]MBU1027779.1 phosphoribosylformylglycinamidine synthase subunit PurS [Nanoarchaeota archaeon]
MQYLVEILVKKKEGVLDPEAAVIEKVAINLGYEVNDLKTSKKNSFVSKKNSSPKAEKEANKLTDELLANKIIEEYKISVIKFRGLETPNEKKLRIGTK